MRRTLLLGFSLTVSAAACQSPAGSLLTVRRSDDGQVKVQTDVIRLAEDVAVTAWYTVPQDSLTSAPRQVTFQFSNLGAEWRFTDNHRVRFVVDQSRPLTGEFYYRQRHAVPPVEILYAFVPLGTFREMLDSDEVVVRLGGETTVFPAELRRLVAELGHRVGDDAWLVARMAEHGL